VYSDFCLALCKADALRWVIWRKDTDFSCSRTEFGLETEELTGVWKELQDESHNLYFSPDVISVIKSRRTRWAGHVARMGKKREMNAVFFYGKTRGN
jgi:hypothetical protein